MRGSKKVNGIVWYELTEDVKFIAQTREYLPSNRCKNNSQIMKMLSQWSMFKSISRRYVCEVTWYSQEVNLCVVGQRNVEMYMFLHFCRNVSSLNTNLKPDVPPKLRRVPAYKT